MEIQKYRTQSGLFFTPMLGRGSKYGMKELEVSDSIFQSISHWIPEFEVPRDRVISMLKEILKTSNSPDKIIKLLVTIEKNLTWEMFEVIEEAKKKLSIEDTVEFIYDNWGVYLRAILARSSFASLIRDKVEEMIGSIDVALNLAKINGEDIDHVLTVGGTSKTVLVKESLVDKFGKEKIASGNLFIDVVSGLTKLSV